MKLTVTEIQRFCMHDGPGLRTTVFLKGCPLRCAWCHNPETKRATPELLLYDSKCIGCGTCVSSCEAGAHGGELTHEIDRGSCRACGRCAELCPTGALELCGRQMTADELIREAERDSAFYGQDGGITLSGGEPFAHGERLLELIKKCAERGLDVAVETCGYADRDVLLKSAPYVSLFLWDIKDTDNERHREYVGASNERIIENLLAVSETGARIRLRCILVNGVNTDAAHYEAVADLAARVKSLDGVELMPYHAYGGTKATFLGGEDNGRAEWIPTEAQLQDFAEMLTHRGVNVI